MLVAVILAVVTASLLVALLYAVYQVGKRKSYRLDLK
jgi:hypothetical protein